MKAKEAGYSPRNTWIMTGVALAAITLAAFWQVQHNGFVIYDDTRYITDNPQVRSGLTREGIRWAFTNLEAGFWHPLTWLSHMVDCELYGLNPQGHHFNNLLLHLANTLLLFLALGSMTGARGRSAVVALLFALHPLHVESVAWASQRKDVLSTLFWMLTLWGYSRYVQKPSAGRYALTLLCFLLGLMAKPMLVTLPFVLLLLDYWPLGRSPVKPPAGGQTRQKETPSEGPPVSFLQLIQEKIPFFLAAFLAAGLAYIAEGHIGALPSLTAVPFEVRISNAFVSTIRYILKMFWPLNLSVIYPRAPELPFTLVALSCLSVVALSGLAVFFARRHPSFFTGWFWYAGTLVPVIGLVQIGSHAMADRYTYVPLIGLFLTAVWGLHEALNRLTQRKGPLRLIVVIVALALAAQTRVQVKVWHDSVSLFEGALEATRDNFVARNHLGYVLTLQGKHQEASQHYREAIRIQPTYLEAHQNLAVSLDLQGKSEEAIRQFLVVLQLNPRLEQAHFQIGNLFSKTGRIDRAIFHYRKAIEIQPANPQVHNNLGLSLQQKGNREEALHHFSEALRIDPADTKAKANLEVLRKAGGLTIDY